jgi:hypothetical protein
MKKSLLLGSLIAAAALTACGKKEEAPAVVAPPAAPAPAPAPAPEPAAAAPAAPAADAADAATEEAKKKQEEGTPPAKP